MENKQIEKGKNNNLSLIGILFLIVISIAAPFAWNHFFAGQWLILLVIEAFLLIVIFTLAHFLWKSSGTGEWKLKIDKKGVKVYTLKVPGETWIKIRVTGKLKARLGSILTLMRNPDAAEDVGMFDSHYIDGSDPKLVYYTFKQKLFFPFKVRDFVVKSEFSQNPVTKEMHFNFVAVPDKLPLNKKCYRITKMHNTWRYTPIGNGEVEFEFVYNAVDPGGNFPYFLANWMMPLILPFAFAKMPETLKKEKYRDAKVDYLLEVE